MQPARYFHPLLSSQAAPSCPGHSTYTLPTTRLLMMSTTAASEEDLPLRPVLRRCLGRPIYRFAWSGSSWVAAWSRTPAFYRRNARSPSVWHGKLPNLFYRPQFTAALLELRAVSLHANSLLSLPIACCPKFTSQCASSGIVTSPPQTFL